MYYAMQSAAEFGKEFLVLDRPNPNDFVDGAMMDDYSLYMFLSDMNEENY